MTDSALLPPRVLACFDERESGQAVIRWAARLATERRAELDALYVEPPGASTRRAPEAAEQLARNRRLAHDLGAQVTILHSHRSAEAILAFAREHAVSVIVLGRAQRAGWRLFGGGVAARVAAHSAGIEVQTVDQ